MRRSRNALLFPIFAWFDLRFYGETTHMERGIAALPWLTTSTAVVLLSTLLMGWSFWGWTQDPDAAYFIDQIPEVSIRNGVVSSSVEQPWVVNETNPETGEDYYLALDTTGSITQIPSHVTEGVLVTRDTLHSIQRTGQTRTVPLDGIEAFDINPELVWTWIGYIGWIGVPLMGLITLAWTLLVRMLLMLGVGAILHAIGKGYGVTFTAGMRIAMLGMVPTMVGFALLDATGLIDFMWTPMWFLWLFLSMIWWGLGLASARSFDDAQLAAAGSGGGEGPWQPPTGY